MPTVRLDGAVIEFLAEGSGDPVVLVPGLGLDTSYFADLSRRLARAGFRAIAVNPRGAGASTGSSDGVTLHTLAADVAAVMDGLPVRPAHLVGHGFGNRVARCLITDRPDLVRSIVLLGGAGRLRADRGGRARTALVGAARREGIRLSRLHAVCRRRPVGGSARPGRVDAVARGRRGPAVSEPCHAAHRP